jgi:small-conductance mechanosensitive channel
VSIGDTITVDKRFGVVSRATARYVVVRSVDGVEAIVPNEIMVTSTVLNHSGVAREVRVGLPLRISYDSDLELAMRVVVEVAAGEPRVLRTPNAPDARVLSFAESGIDLELGIWINDPEKDQGPLKSALYLGIWRAFRENGIKIPFPQREVRLIDGGAAADGRSDEGERPH